MPVTFLQVVPERLILDWNRSNVKIYHGCGCRAFF